DKPLIGCMSDAKAMKRGHALLVSTTNFLFKAVIDQDVHKKAIQEATRKVLGEALTPRLVDENDILSFDGPKEDEAPAAEAEPEDPDSVPSDLANPSPDYHKPERKKVPEVVGKDLYEVKLSEERLAESQPEEDDSDVKIAKTPEEPLAGTTAETGFNADAPTFNTLGKALELPEEDAEEDKPHTTTFTLPDIDTVRTLQEDEDEEYEEDLAPLPDDADVPAPNGADLYPELNESVGFRFADQELLGGIGEPEVPAQEPADEELSPDSESPTRDPADETREEDPLDDFLGNLDKLGVNYEIEE
ncbi:MAG: hypothetical protein J6Y62_06170, partial [Clostridia bacterium]|nr:hypothetical protein [Clostridia bacterium]